MRKNISAALAQRVTGAVPIQKKQAWCVCGLCFHCANRIRPEYCLIVGDTWCMLLHMQMHVRSSYSLLLLLHATAYAAHVCADVAAYLALVTRSFSSDCHGSMHAAVS
jgi:hypothetical protein